MSAAPSPVKKPRIVSASPEQPGMTRTEAYNHLASLMMVKAAHELGNHNASPSAKKASERLLKEASEIVDFEARHHTPSSHHFKILEMAFENAGESLAKETKANPEAMKVLDALNAIKRQHDAAAENFERVLEEKGRPGVEHLVRTTELEVGKEILDRSNNGRVRVVPEVHLNTLLGHLDDMNLFKHTLETTRNIEHAMRAISGVGSPKYKSTNFISKEGKKFSGPLNIDREAHFKALHRKLH